MVTILMIAYGQVILMHESAVGPTFGYGFAAKLAGRYRARQQRVFPAIEEE